MKIILMGTSRNGFVTHVLIHVLIAVKKINLLIFFLFKGGPGTTNCTSCWGYHGTREARWYVNETRTCDTSCPASK